MRVAMVACIQPGSSRPSGIATYVENVLDALSKRGIETMLIGRGDVQESTVDFKFVSLAKSRGISSAGFLARLVSRASSLDIAPGTIIHTHRPDDAIPFILLKNSNPTVITLHGSHLRNVVQNRGQLIGSAYRLAEHFSLRRNAAVISVSRENERLYREMYPWLQGKLVHVPQGVDTVRFRPLDGQSARQHFGLADEDVVVLYAGRFEKEKRIDLLIRSFTFLRRRMPTARLLVVGDGREESSLRYLVANDGVQGVTFMSPVSRSKMPLLLNCADVFALLSSHEGLPLVILEALSCGIPVVSTPVGDVPEVVADWKTGRLLSSLEPVDIAEVLGDVVAHRSDYVDACRQASLTYSWDSVADRLIQLYEGV